ncbi:MAG: heme exporter protein CcmD [Acidobacteria bacterium]|nr:heme exporter protein CcmD [Acidobacteriota bacterium]
MDDIGFILASWAVTLGSIAVLAVATLRSAKQLARRVPDQHKPWR